MAVRLSKIAREVNVGIASLVDFLNKNGVKAENDPNVKVSDEAYDLIWKAYGKGEKPSLEKKQAPAPAVEESRPEAATAPEAPKPAPEAPKPEPIAVAEPKVAPEAPKPEPELAEKPAGKQAEKPVEPQAPEAEKPAAETPKAKPAETSEPQQFKPLGKIDLSTVGKPKPAPKAPEAAKAPEAPKPVAEQPKPAVEETPQEPVAQEPAKPAEPEVFKYGENRTMPGIKVVKTIDLASLNQFTRPKKKTKAEKQKEQEERRAKEAAEKKQRAEGARPAQQPAGNAPAGASGDAKKKRNRIRDGKVRVDASEYNNGGYSSSDRQNVGRNNARRGKVQPGHTDVDTEDVSKQVRDTLARMTAKPKKGTKYRKEKREAVMQHQLQREQREAAENSIIKITEFVTVNDLANMMDVPVVQVISKCMEMGQMVSINQRLDAETINIVADEFGFTTEYVSADVMQAIHEEEDKEEDLVPRPPIITVMGHVDHGKTSLLDYIRQTNVIAGEAGGITQHIGAYNVKLADGRQITFLDTPGHEAFTAMRARGAKMTDIAIIIVAADDSVMPQTVEAINHASIAGVPIVFAINKIDKPTADAEKIKKQLAEMNYLVEDWGGKYQSQDISAKKGLNVPELLEKVLLEAEMLDLKANPNKRAVGTIVESSLDKGRGYVATVLVQNGTLRIGDIMVAGTNHGRIKAMFNERGQKIKQAAPGEPALILGLNGAPQAGDNFNVLETEQEAREVANKREQLQREQGLRTGKILTLAEIGRRIAVGNFKELNIIVKGDVDGSVEALSDSLLKLSTEQIQVNVIHKAVGQISESDVTLASASDAVIVGFQVRPSLTARRMAEHEGVEIRLYSIIYDAIEEVKAAMEGMLAPELKEEIIGSAEVRETFKISKVGTVAGCMVKEGRIKRGCKVRLIRDGIVVYTGELDSLKRFKDDAKEVTVGFECGMSIVGYNDIKVGDFIESFETREVKQTL